MKVIVESDHILGRMVNARVEGDPFPCYLDHRQLEITGEIREMARKSARELRKQAKSLGIEGYLDMDIEELEASIAATGEGDVATEERTTKSKAGKDTTKSKKTKVKKAKVAEAEVEEEAEEEEKPAKSKKAKKAAKSADKPENKAKAPSPEGPNPFRPGTNLWYVTEALMKGGKRSKLVDKLVNSGKLEFNPRKKADGFEERKEIDRRLKVVGYILRDKHGFTYESEGRGEDAFIKATPPGE